MNKLTEDAEIDPLEALAARTWFPIDDTVEQSDDDGAGCAGGVSGSPCLNVDPPYTPII